MEKEILSFVEVIFSERDIIEVLNKITVYTKELVKAERVTLFLYNREDEVLESIVITGENITKINLKPSYESIAGYTFLTGRIVNITDAYDEIEIKSIHPELKHDKRWDIEFKYRTKSVLAVPVVRTGEIVGVLELINKRSESQKFIQEDEDTVKILVKFIAIAVENGLTIYNLLKNEQEKKVIIENISEAVAITNSKLQLMDFNSSFLEMVGFRWESDSMLGLDIKEVLPEIGDILVKKSAESISSGLSIEINLNLLKVKVLPIFISEFGEKKLKKIVFIFRYPKG